MSIIGIDRLTFSYSGGETPIFQDLTLHLDTDWKLGLIGRNGKGKTTLLRILLGELEYSGKITSSSKFTPFPYTISDRDAYTIDVIHEIAPDALDWEIRRECSLLGLDDSCFYLPFSLLSNGEQTKIQLAALFLLEHHFLLIDEPTNHLDEQARALLGNYLSSKQGFLLVSHDRTLLDNCTDHILALNRSSIELQSGNFSSWQENKRRQDQFEFAENEKRRREITRLRSAAKQTETWSNKVEKTKNGTKNSGLRPDKGFIGHKAAKMMQRSKNIENRQQKMIEEKSKLLKNIEKTEALKIPFLRHHQSRLVSAENLSIFYDDRMICNNISFTLEQGDRMHLSGKNGSGKSSIIKLILGDDIHHSGMLTLASGLIVSYVSQNTDHLSGSIRDFAAQMKIDETLLLTILRKLDFSREQFILPMDRYSAGQKKKVLLAASLCQQAHLYIWDEPLNFIDIFSRIQIEELILNEAPTLLFVEHDAKFGENIATKRLVLPSNNPN